MLFDIEKYIANFIAKNGKKPNFIPSGKFRPNGKPYWISNKY